MTIKITRDTGFSGMFTRMKLFLDGEIAGYINEDETVVIDVENSPTILKTRLFGARSNQIEVESGDEIIIKFRNIEFIFIPILLFIAVIENIFNAPLIYIILTFALGLLLFLFVDAYKIIKLD